MNKYNSENIYFQTTYFVTGISNLFLILILISCI